MEDGDAQRGDESARGDALEPRGDGVRASASLPADAALHGTASDPVKGGRPWSMRRRNIISEGEERESVRREPCAGARAPVRITLLQWDLGATLPLFPGRFERGRGRQTKIQNA